MIVLNCEFNCWPGFDDWLIFGLGVLVSIGWALYIYFFLRPKLEIGVPSISELEIKGNKRCIDIPIKNLSRFSKATKLSLEVALIEGNKTYHMKTDTQNFSFIPKKRKNSDPKRTFKAFDSTDFLKEFYGIQFPYLLSKLEEPNTELRVRIHATHSFSGLGSTQEKKFIYCQSQNIFIIKKH